MFNVFDLLNPSDMFDLLNIPEMHIFANGLIGQRNCKMARILKHQVLIAQTSPQAFDVDVDFGVGFDFNFDFDFEYCKFQNSALQPGLFATFP